jgi:hypothetical protein
MIHTFFGIALDIIDTIVGGGNGDVCCTLIVGPNNFSNAAGSDLISVFLDNGFVDLTYA